MNDTERKLANKTYVGVLRKPYISVLKENQNNVLRTKEMEMRALSYILSMYNHMKEWPQDKRVWFTRLTGLSIPEIEELARVYAKRLRKAKGSYRDYDAAATFYLVDRDEDCFNKDSRALEGRHKNIGIK